jgi:hypothetical protein
VLVKAKDTIFVWWHGTDMKAPTFDSLAFHFTTLGNRWTDARLRLRWDAPIQNAYSGSVTHLKLEGTESDGGHRIIEGDVIMNPSLNEPQIWKTYSSRLVR